MKLETTSIFDGVPEPIEFHVMAVFSFWTFNYMSTIFWWIDDHFRLIFFFYFEFEILFGFMDFIGGAD